MFAKKNVPVHLTELAVAAGTNLLGYASFSTPRYHRGLWEQFAEKVHELNGKEMVRKDRSAEPRWEKQFVSDKSNRKAIASSASPHVEALGPYVRVSLDLNSEESLKEFNEIVLKGKVFPGLLGDTRFWYSGMITQQGGVTLYMTPNKGVDMFKEIGVEMAAGTASQAVERSKRGRRFLAPAKFTTKGEILSRTRSLYSVVFLDGSSEAFSCTDLHVRFDNGSEFVFRVPELPKKVLDKVVLGQVDGMQLIDPEVPNALFDTNYQELDGLKLTVMSQGQFKGHALLKALSFCNGVKLGGVLFDRKDSLRLRNSNSFYFSILDEVHGSDTVCTEIQMITNFLLGKLDLLKEWSEAAIQDAARLFNDPEALAARFTDPTKRLPWVDELGDGVSVKGIESWVLARALRAKEHGAVDPNTGDFVSIPFDVRNHPQLLKAAFRVLLKEIMDVTEFRIPIPEGVAVRRYLMADPAIFQCSGSLDFSKALLGKGECWINKDVLRTAFFRQPSGSVLEHWLMAVRYDLYRQYKSSPFLFLNPEDLVIVLGELGGGDLDDAIVAFLSEEVVDYFWDVVSVKADEYRQLPADIPQIGTLVASYKKDFQAFADARSSDAVLSYNCIDNVLRVGELVYNMGAGIGPVINLLMNFNEQWWNGRTQAVSLAPVGRHTELIIDSSNKTGERLPWVDYLLNSYKDSVQDVAAYLSDRIPAGTFKRRKEGTKTVEPNPIWIVETEADAILKAICDRVEEFEHEFFDGILKDNQLFKGAMYTYIRAFVATQEQLDLGTAVYNTYNKVRAAVAAKTEKQLKSLPEFANSGETISRFSSIEGANQAAKAVWEEHFADQYGTNRELVYGAMLVNYQRVYRTDNRFAPSDALLWNGRMGHLMMESLRYGWDCYLNPSDPEPVPEDRPEPEVDSSVLSAPVVFGASKWPTEEREAWKAKADGRTVQVHYLDKSDPEAMFIFRRLASKEITQNQDACVVIDGSEVMGWIPTDHLDTALNTALEVNPDGMTFLAGLYPGSSPCTLELRWRMSDEMPEVDPVLAALGSESHSEEVPW